MIRRTVFCALLACAGSTHPASGQVEGSWFQYGLGTGSDYCAANGFCVEFLRATTWGWERTAAQVTPTSPSRLDWSGGFLAQFSNANGSPLPSVVDYSMSIHWHTNLLPEGSSRTGNIQGLQGRSCEEIGTGTRAECIEGDDIYYITDYPVMAHFAEYDIGKPVGWRVSSLSVDFADGTRYGFSEFGSCGDRTCLAAVPEPATYALLLTGLLGLGVVAWRRRNSLT